MWTFNEHLCMIMFMSVRGNELDLYVWELHFETRFNLHTVCNKRPWSFMSGPAPVYLRAE